MRHNKKFKQNTYVAYFEPVPITPKYGMVQIKEALSLHTITDLHIMREPFGLKNIQNQIIYDISCLRFDLLQD
jgi:hypothetical protein